MPCRYIYIYISLSIHIYIYIYIYTIICIIMYYEGLWWFVQLTVRRWLQPSLGQIKRPRLCLKRKLENGRNSKHNHIDSMIVNQFNRSCKQVPNQSIWCAIVFPTVGLQMPPGIPRLLGQYLWNPRGSRHGSKQGLPSGPQNKGFCNCLE